MLKLRLKDVLGQSRRKDNGIEWAAGFLDDRDTEVSSAWATQ